MNEVELAAAAAAAVRDCAKVCEGESVLVVADTLHPLAIGSALCAAAEARGARSDLLVTRSRAQRLSGWEPALLGVTGPVAAAMREADVVFTLTNPYLLGTDAQDAALAAGARIVTLMYFDRFRHPTQMSHEEIMGDFVRMMSVDLPAMDELTERLGAALERATHARVRSPAGTDLAIEHAGNRAAVLGGVVRPMGDRYRGAAAGSWAHSPAGVACVVPATADGTIVCDLSMVPLGHVGEPVKLRLHDRRVVAIEGGESARRLRAHLEAFEDDAVYSCPAEWGLGTNPAAVASGRFLEEEVLYGVPHIALGDDTRFHNGTNYAPFHSDIMLRGASVELDGKVVLDRGRYRL